MEMKKCLIDLTFVATDQIDIKVLLNEALLFESYLKEEGGHLGLESVTIDNEVNINHMLAFLFGTNFSLSESMVNSGKQLIDLTTYKKNCISFDQLEKNYQDWIKLTNRENTMDEYGTLLGVIGYVHRNLGKNHLVLIIEKRSLF
jgi:hypothetical protein